MAYTAPTIKDRVAAGDNKYTMQTLSDGRVLLTPSPDEVEEAGTEINKVLLQPLFDIAASHDTMIEAMLASLGILAPYEDYWWRTQTNAGSYTLAMAASGSISGAYYHETINKVDGTSDDFYAIPINKKTWDSDGSYSDNGSQTIQYASSITMDSSGHISLVNPTTITVNADTVTSYENTLRGKYVTGLKQNESLIYKIGQYSSIATWTPNPRNYGSYTRYTQYWGYRSSSPSGLSSIEVAVARYSSTSSDYIYLHNPDPNFYPHSGTTNGTEYQYLGKIYDAATADAPFSLKTANITSASWSDKVYSVPIHVSRYFVTWVTGSYKFIGIVDRLKMYGIAYTSTSSWSVQTGASSVTLGAVTSTPQSNALRFSYSGTSAAPVVTVNYLPLS